MKSTKRVKSIKSIKTLNKRLLLRCFLYRKMHKENKKHKNVIQTTFAQMFFIRVKRIKSIKSIKMLNKRTKTKKTTFS